MRETGRGEGVGGEGTKRDRRRMGRTPQILEHGCANAGQRARTDAAEALSAVITDAYSDGRYYGVV